jgi:threonine dehydrogenase-like Zn-dependent dehydrogenase
MRAVVWDGVRVRVVDDLPPPAIADGDALVRVRRAGICSTDLEILSGYMGFRGIPGHEFVGDVLAGPTDLIGSRVVGEINFACERCATCSAGRPRHCPARLVLGIVGADGAFADLVRLPARNLHRVPDDWSDSQAVFVEPTAAAIEADEQTREYAGQRTLVVGAGKLGLLIGQVMASRGDQVMMLARRKTAVATANSVELEAATADPSPGGWDLVVDATGDAEGLPIALRAVRPRGAIVMKSTRSAPYNVDLAPLVVNEVVLIGSRCGPFAPAIEALATRRVRVDPMIEGTFALRDAEEAFRRAAAPGALKVLLAPQP